MRSSVASRNRIGPTQHRPIGCGKGFEARRQLACYHIGGIKRMPTKNGPGDRPRRAIPRSQVRFALDSPLEGAVHCELVSEVKISAPVTKLGADSGRVMDDSGIVKRCFALEFRRKLSSLPWQPAPHSDN